MSIRRRVASPSNPHGVCPNRPARSPCSSQARKQALVLDPHGLPAQTCRTKRHIATTQPTEKTHSKHAGVCLAQSSKISRISTYPFCKPRTKSRWAPSGTKFVTRHQVVWRFSRPPWDVATVYLTISWPEEVAWSSGSAPRRPVRVRRATEWAGEELKARAVWGILAMRMAGRRDERKADMVGSRMCGLWITKYS